jgi:Cu/Ag efflux protein CusF
MEPEERMSKASGTVQQLDPGARSLTVHGLVLNKSFEVANDAVIAIRANPAAKLTDLKVGDCVEVSYEDQGAVTIAHRIAQTAAAAQPTSEQQREAA